MPVAVASRALGSLITRRPRYPDAPKMLKAATSLNHPIVLATGELAFLAHPMATTRVGDPKDSVDVDLTPQFYEY